MASSNAELAARTIQLARVALKSTYDNKNGPIKPLGERQKASRVDRGPPQSVWTVPVSFPQPDQNELRDILLEAVCSLGDDTLEPPPLEIAPVNAEWVGIRRGDLQEIDESLVGKFTALCRDTRCPATIIFVHGGAFFQNGLGSARPSALKLAKESGAKVLSLDYRLAPQSAFPSQILDLLVLYLSLLYPPPGSIHEALSASSIIIAGESAGGCISLSFCQLLLYLKGRSVSFHGQTVPVPMPGGFATVSCQGDQALCLPSWTANKQWDIWDEKAPYLDPEFPPDDIWPSRPPREDVYCSAAFFDHPMVSLCTAKSWKGAPTLWFGIGQERLADSCKLIAQTAFCEGVPVLWNQYEAMPHCWMFFMAKLPHAAHLWRRWELACKQIAYLAPTESRGSWIEVETFQESPVHLDKLTDLRPSEAKAMIRANAQLRKVFYGKRPAAQL